MMRIACSWLTPVVIVLMLPRGGVAASPLCTFVLPIRIEGKVPALVMAQPLKPEPGDDDLRKLLKERYNAALREVKAWYAEIFAGSKYGWPRDEMLDAAFRALETEFELSDKPWDQIRIRQEQFEWAKEHERVIGFKFEAGRVGPIELARSNYLRVDAAIRLLQARRRVDAIPPTKPEPRDNELRTLLTARYNAAVGELKALQVEFSRGSNHRIPRDVLVKAMLRMFDAKLALSDKTEDHILIREEQVSWAKEHERVIRSQYDRHHVEKTELEKALYMRLDAEIKLLQTKRKAAAGQLK